MKKLLIAVVAATGVLGAVVAYALQPSPAIVCEPTDTNTCKGKADATWWNSWVGACYSAKVSCKGNFVGSQWQVDVTHATNLSVLEVFTVPFGQPACAAAASDPEGVKSVKAHCDTDSVAQCTGAKGELRQESSHAKASVKRRDDLCPVTCVKPDKISGCP
jgi:hypothetical protein